MVDLEKDLKKILMTYTNEIKDAIFNDIDEVAKETVNELKRTSPSRSGKYAKNWATTTEQKRLYKTATIHNVKKYRLTHLLENGHALVRGGRTVGQVDAKPHIALAEEKAIKNLEEKVEKSINDTY